MALKAQALGSNVTEPNEFIRGKEYVHSNGKVVRFDDDDWCISTKRGKRLTVTFRGLPNWLERPAKLTLTDGWLIRGRGLSWVAGCASTFRKMASWIDEFTGTSIAELPAESVLRLELRLDRELVRYSDTLEEKTNELGRSLTDREKRRLCLTFKLHGPKSIRTFVLMFNAAASISEEIDGLLVPVRLRTPRALRQVEIAKPIGSADPNKVLRPEQIGELERALNLDFTRYDKATRRLNKYLEGLDLTKIKEDTPSSLFDVERYFGINGCREHSSTEIVQLRGLSPNTAPDVPRRIRRFLTPRLDSEIIDKLLSLRSRYTRLISQNKTAEVASSRRYIRDILSKADLSDPDLRPICIEKYFGLNGRRRHSAAIIADEVGLERITALNYIETGLTALVGARTARRLLAIRKRLRYYLTRAIKAQALRLQLATARRVGAIVDLPVDPRTKVSKAAGHRVLEIQFRSVKTWGDEGLLEWVPCVDRFADIAQDAIRTAQQLTRDWRTVANDGAEAYLFIIPDKNSDSAVQLTTKVLLEYIYCNQPGKADLLQRNGLEELSNFQSHHARHTMATHMIEGGGTLQDVARYLSHASFGGTTSIAGTFYLAGGTEAMRTRSAEALRRGAATGFVFDAIAKLKIEAMGPDTVEAAVPLNQLTFQEARKRILSADILEDMPVDPLEAIKLLDQNVIFNVTRYGGCLLQADSGLCPTANPCPIGIQPRGVEPQPGCGCKYLVLTPDSVEQLTSDIALMEGQVMEMNNEKLVGWKSHTEAKIAHYRSLLVIAQSLNGQD